MLPRICTLLLGAGISGAMALLAPVASAIEPLEPQAVVIAAHEGDGVNAVGFAVGGPEGYWVISGGEDATLRSWTPQLYWERTQTLHHEIYDLEASIDGSIVATGEGGWNGGTSTDTLRIWPALGFDIDSTAGHDGIGAPIGFVYVVTISPDNKYIAVSGFYGQILISDILTSSRAAFAP
jgi:WD40 repeat protein